MIAAQQGDETAYSRLLLEVRGWLLDYFGRRLAAAAAEDAAQETLIAIHSRRADYRDIGPFAPWLRTIARYKWIDQLRAQRRYVEFDDGFEIATADHGPSTRASVLVEMLLAELKPAQAAAIRLTRLQGASIDEAADATGQSTSLVKVNAHRGLRKAASRLNAES